MLIWGQNSVADGSWGGAEEPQRGDLSRPALCACSAQSSRRPGSSQIPGMPLPSAFRDAMLYRGDGHSIPWQIEKQQCHVVVATARKSCSLCELQFSFLTTTCYSPSALCVCAYMHMSNMLHIHLLKYVLVVEVRRQPTRMGSFPPPWTKSPSAWWQTPLRAEPSLFPLAFFFF